MIYYKYVMEDLCSCFFLKALGRNSVNIESRFIKRLTIIIDLIQDISITRVLTISSCKILKH